MNNDFYYVITYDPSDIVNEKIPVSLFLNGNNVDNGYVYEVYWDKFIGRNILNKYCELGRCTTTEPGNWMYLNGYCYCLRFYNRALSSDEVKLNYDKTKAYRAVLNNKN